MHVQRFAALPGFRFRTVIALSFHKTARISLQYGKQLEGLRLRRSVRAALHRAANSAYLLNKFATH